MTIRLFSNREAFRARVRQVACPFCGAATEERCRSRRDQGRLSVHQPRIDAWLLAGRPS